MEPGCPVTRRTDHVLPPSFMAEAKENTQTAWPRSCAECDHSNLVSSLHFITREMRLIQSWLQSEPESDCVINTSEDCQTLTTHEKWCQILLSCLQVFCLITNLTAI